MKLWYVASLAFPSFTYILPMDRQDRQTFFCPLPGFSTSGDCAPTVNTDSYLQLRTGRVWLVGEVEDCLLTNLNGCGAAVTR